MNAGFGAGVRAGGGAAIPDPSTHSRNAITFVAQITPPVASSPVALPANSLLLVRMYEQVDGGQHVATVGRRSRRGDDPSQVFCRRCGPGPGDQRGSNAANAGPPMRATRYFAAAHVQNRRPRSQLPPATVLTRAAWTGVAGAGAAGFRPDVIPHCARTDWERPIDL